MVLLRFILREVQSRPGRAILTLLSIVIAVATLVSVKVSTETSSHAYQEMYEQVAGRTDLEVVSAEVGASYDASILAQVQQTPGVKAAVPSFSSGTRLYFGEGEKTARVGMLLMGIDVKSDEAIRDYRLEEGQFFVNGEGAVMEIGFARALGIKVGDEIRVNTNRLVQRLEVVGLLAPEGAAHFNQGGIVFVPLETAQWFFKSEGRVTTIAVVLEDGAEEAKVQAAIAQVLPQGVEVRPPAFRTSMGKESLAEAEQGLRFAYQLALALAVIMILNTFLMNVGERRKQLAILRAIGTTRGQLMRMLLAEGLLMGIVGTVIGCVLGLAGAQGLSSSMSKVMNIAMPNLVITYRPFLTAALMGPGLAVVAMLIPALIARKVTPLEGMRPMVSREGGRVPGTFVAIGLILSAITAAVLAASLLGYLPSDYASPSGIVFTMAFLLMIPAMLGPMTWVMGRLTRPFLGYESELARRQVLRRRVRTSLTIGILYVAVSSGIGLGTTIINVVRDVRNWHAQTFIGEYYVRVMFTSTNNTLPRMPESLGDELRAIPGITNVDTLWTRRDAKIEDQTGVLAVRGFTAPGPLPLDLRGGDPEDIRRRLFQGEVVVGSVLMQKTGKQVGDTINVHSAKGSQPLRICAMINDYMAGGMMVQMERQSAKRLLDVDGVDMFMISAAPGTYDAVEPQLRALTDKNGLMLQSLAELRVRVDGIINGVIASLWGLLALGFLVAAFGTANTLTMNVLEQTRELAMLRVVAMTRRQVRKCILGQAAVIGGIGLASGIFGGLTSSYITNLGTWALLGRSVAFSFQPMLLLTCALAGFLLVLAAALLPAERAARLNLLIALQYE